MIARAAAKWGSSAPRRRGKLRGMIFRLLPAAMLLGLLALRAEGGPFSPREEPPALPLAANGFCVVTLRDGRQWAAG